MQISSPRPRCRSWPVALLIVCLGAVSPASAEITWWFDFANSDANVPDNILNQITEAMDSAVYLYNAYAGYELSDYSSSGDPRGLRVIYDSSIPTANAGYRGRVAFGGKINDWTAMHEMAHVFGVGTYRLNGVNIWNQNRNTSTNKWTGPVAIAELQELNGPDASLNADRIHFWPHGLNVQDGDRESHVRMVGALRDDMGLSNGNYDFSSSDFNQDGVLSSLDIDMFTDNWLSTNSDIGFHAHSKGDRNFDGVTDLADWVLIRQDFLNDGGRVLELSSVIGVPEPGTLSGFLSLAGAMLATGRRRSRG